MYSSFSCWVVTPIDGRDSCFSYIHLQISHGIWNEYCSFSWSDLEPNFKVFQLEKCLRIFVTLMGMFLYVSALYFGILRITMDFTAGLSWSVTEAVEQSMLHNSWEKWHHFMLCLDLSLRKKGQIISLVFTQIEQVAHVLDHYLCENIWIPWWPVLIV